ncbi:unnamed protein product [Rotaria magnacalcarata]|uniref:SH3 domain-containing protein n=1 Tax=Rotaria magnacalcarata TaxID=392030 RepID=A0A816QGI9_9BILA|nr:unnamed protein product [Rotaria magnacalcarata]CAF1980131.1 unnamed protein product [Rotaria magnacalcarata]CAF2060108.1 unnamed protein product [Rotaria magnacalcarata]
MTDEFRDCFVGEKGYDALKKLMRNSNEFCTEIANCLLDRSDAEKVYAKALRKNSDIMQKIAGRTRGTLSNAFTMLATQTNRQSDAHSEMANVLLNDIFTPIKNLADTQNRERRAIEETMNAKFKEWNNQKSNDNKFRSRQFEKSEEIEILYLKLSELPKIGRKHGRDTVKENTSAQLAMSCIMPSGRGTSASEKSISNSDDKYQANLEMDIQKAFEQLKGIEKRYHESTKTVELTRQSCATELCRSCDKAQRMELDRITEMKNFTQSFINSIQKFCETMYQISHDLNSIQISPNEDIITQARSNSQSNELEILLYDIYAENQNAMNEERRLTSLNYWIDLLNRDISIQQQMNNAYGVSNRDGSMSLSNDDGAMCSGKDKRRENKNTEAVERFSNELSIDRSSTRLIHCLYEASLYKLQSVYNRINNLPPLQYEHSHCYAKTYNEKGHPTTLLRIPLQSSAQVLPSAPSATRYFAEAMPLSVPISMQQPPVVQPMQTQPPPIGFVIDNISMRSSALERSLTTTNRQVYPDLPVHSTEFSEKKLNKLVKAIYPYTAAHRDELDLKEGDCILLMERRPDQWYKGELNGKIGLFPGTFVTDA